ncbi:MAG: hypothetical protein HN982_05035 [Candidatus Marinimicrobia bacterium]|jgi:hypothetical protein|nr:hypothetical protein [Candidatus Neomarinimicrobiota bacterium]|tara:strand:+ start:120 stop:512 length:393 start_codon:yes stop_codon:yes gene_type:complete
MNDFDKYFNEVVGTIQLSKVERNRYKESLRNTIKRWEIKGIISENELPDVNGKLIWDWKMSQDKDMVIQMVESLSKRIFNYRRKIFGLKDTSPNKTYISHYVNELMKEGMPISYPNQKLIDKFFSGEKIE